MPPETGNSPPSSAWTSASTPTMIDATTQAMIADGPAIVTAVSAPNSQPEPISDASEAHVRPRKLIPRSIPSLSSVACCSCWPSSLIPPPA